MTVSVSQYKFCTREISRLTTEKANTKGYTQNHYGISKCNSKKYSSNPHEKARKRTQNKKLNKNHIRKPKIKQQT